MKSTDIKYPAYPLSTNKNPCISISFIIFFYRFTEQECFTQDDPEKKRTGKPLEFIHTFA
jgi:hypothetical protein